VTAYADTGFLCSLYASDAHTNRAVARIEGQRLPLAFTWLHQLELRNALRLKVFRRESTPEQSTASLNVVLADIAAGILMPTVPPSSDVSTEAERLSAQWSSRLGTRALDLLHVAGALVLGIDEFLTFDTRQAALAKAAGLRVPRLA
jgi:predicted nucleic acid-binding protein